jgi:small redox-active disulfide protein 2
MKIQVLGPGCTNCERLYENTIEAIKRSGLLNGIVVEKVRDVDSFIRIGVFTTPALVIDGKIISVGRVLSAVDILEVIKKKKQ